MARSIWECAVVANARSAAKVLVAFMFAVFVEKSERRIERILLSMLTCVVCVFRVVKASK